MPIKKIARFLYRNDVYNAYTATVKH